MRSFLRVIGFIVAFILLFSIIFKGLQFAAEKIQGVDRLSVRGVLAPWLLFASGAIATYLMVRAFEKLPWSAVALDRSAASPGLLIKGAAFGGLTIGIASLVLLGFNQLQIQSNVSAGWWTAAGQSTAILLPAAFSEELVFRGYIFFVIRRAAGWKTALIITSVVFGFVHAWNPGADAESVLAVIVAGFFLGVILLATRSLYAAGVAHFFWNWVMAVLLHIEVSGLASPNPDYRTVETGPDWLTGGPWGPEGGVAAVAAMFIGIFYLYGRYLRGMEWKA